MLFDDALRSHLDGAGALWSSQSPQLHITMEEWVRTNTTRYTPRSKMGPNGDMEIKVTTWIDYCDTAQVAQTAYSIRMLNSDLCPGDWLTTKTVVDARNIPSHPVEHTEYTVTVPRALHGDPVVGEAGGLGVHGVPAIVKALYPAPPSAEIYNLECALDRHFGKGGTVDLQPHHRVATVNGLHFYDEDENELMLFDDIEKIVERVFPNWTVERDNTGQAIIYTGGDAECPILKDLFGDPEHPVLKDLGFADAAVEQDNSGQIVIYTGMWIV